MNLKFINRLYIIVVNLHLYLVLDSLICVVKCNEDDSRLSVVQEFAVHRIRKNLTESVHSRLEQHLDFLRSDDDGPFARRLFNTLRPSPTNYPSIAPNPSSQFTPISGDPLWNSNNRFSNRFDRYDNTNRRPPSNQFTYPPYPSFNFTPFPTTTIKPKSYTKSIYKPTNSIRPSNAGVAASSNIRPVSSNIRPVHERPTYSRPNKNRHPKYNADCACKRRIGGGGGFSQLVSTESPFTVASTTTALSATTVNTRANSNRQSRSRNYNSINYNNNKDNLDTRIVNGTLANYYQFPWTVSLGRAINDKYMNDSHYCGATLIAPLWLLTAGHCLTDFKPKKIIVAYGSGNRSAMKHFAEVDRLVVHPQYTGWPKYLNDIALVKLKQPVQLDASIKPACLQSTYTRLYEELDAVGWGRIGVEGI